MLKVPVYPENNFEFVDDLSMVNFFLFMIECFGFMSKLNNDIKILFKADNVAPIDMSVDGLLTTKVKFILNFIYL